MTNTTVTDWNSVISAMPVTTTRFAQGRDTGQTFYQIAQKRGIGGEVRRLLRTRGVTYARRLARKSLRHRGMIV